MELRKTEDTENKTFHLSFAHWFAQEPIFFLATVRSSLLLIGSVLPSSMGKRLL